MHDLLLYLIFVALVYTIGFLTGIIKVLKEIRNELHIVAHNEAIRLVFLYQVSPNRPPEEITMLTLTDIQGVDLSVAPVDAKGNPAKVDGAPVWVVSAPDVCDIAVAADGLSAHVTAKGPLGSCQVTVTADADLGEGVRNITGMLDVEVIASEAASLSITAGAPA